MNAGDWGRFAVLVVLAAGTIAWWAAPAVHARRVRKSDPNKKYGYELPVATDEQIADWIGVRADPPTPSARNHVLYQPTSDPVARRRAANKRARAARRVHRSRVS